MSEPAPSAAETAPITDLPTGEPLPPQPPPPPPPQKPNTPTTTTTNPIARLLTSTDAFLAHLQRALSTPAGIDTTLLFICYSSRLASAALSTLSTRAPHLLLQRPSQTAPLALLATRLKNLGSLASEARTIARLWSLLSMYAWARRLVLAPTAATVVDAAQLASCAVFQALENGAYLSSKGVLGWTPRQQARAYLVGARALAVYTGLELGKLLAELAAAVALQRNGRDRQRRRDAPQDNKTQAEVAVVVDDEAKAAAAAAAAAEEEERVHMEAVRRNLIINLAWTPLTLHWSTEGGLIGDGLVGLGGCIPGVIQLRKLWRETAK